MLSSIEASLQYRSSISRLEPSKELLNIIIVGLRVRGQCFEKEGSELKALAVSQVK